MRQIGPQLISVMLVLVMVLALPAFAPAQTAAPEGPAVFPGMQFSSDEGTCTLGFLFQRVVEGDDPRPPEYYAVTAGHCALDGDGGEQVWTEGDGPRVVATNQDLAPFGRYVFAGLAVGFGEPYDLALIRLDGPAELLDPAVCYLGGPTKLDVTPRSGEGETLWQVGHSQDALQPRPGRAVDMSGPRVVYQGAGFFGDSGGPVLGPDGAALGVLAAIGNSSDEPPEGTHKASRLSVQLPHAEQALGLELELMTAPRNEVDWPTDAIGTAPCGS